MNYFLTRWLLAGVAALAALQCPRKALAQDTNVVQLGARPESSLSLRIVATHERRQALDRTPWHTAGGEWTFLDCEWPAAENARILIGIKTLPAGSTAPFDWGAVQLSVSDRSAAGKIVQALARALGISAPPPHGEKPPGLLKGKMAVLGTKLIRSAAGGFTGEGRGTWTATKWFFEDEFGESELYFNFNLIEKRAEFGEKDEEHREDLIAHWIAGLRDGPLPPRTPEFDPNLTSMGPRTGNWVHLTDSSALVRFTADGKGLLFFARASASGSTIHFAPVARPLERISLGELKGETYLMAHRSGNTGPMLIVREVFRPDPKVWSPDDPERFWFLDMHGRQDITPPQELTKVFAWKEALSPDANFVLLEGREGKGQQTSQVLLFYNLAERQWRRVLPPKPVLIVGWERQPLRAIVIQGGLLHTIDPATGIIAKLEPSPSHLLPGRVVSPDGRQFFKIIGKDRLLIGDLTNGKSRDFVFGLADRRSVFEGSLGWANERYVSFSTSRPALIDTVTLKMSFPEPPDSKMGNFEFNAPFTAVLASNQDGMFLGRVLPVTALEK